MNIKEIVRPTLVKILITLLLIGLTYLIPKTDQLCAMTPEGVLCGNQQVKGIGYPLFYGEKFTGDAIYPGWFSPINLLLNIIIYYLLSSAIIYVYTLLRKK